MMASRLQKVLEAGEFAVTAEIGPPKGADPANIKHHARLLAPCTDALNLTDNQTAVVRLCSLAAAVHVLGEGGEPVVQMTTRDRNRIGLQSDILGAASLGVRNLLCLTGDHPVFGNHPGSKGVFDLDSIQLLDMARGMNEGRFLNGEAIKSAPEFFLGATENPYADPLEYRVLRLRKKVAAGARFIQTQVVYDLAPFRRFMAQAVETGVAERVHILAGVTPPRSAKALKFMAGIPGFSVPEELIRRMEGASDQKREGLKIATEIIREVRTIPGVRGVHIMAIMAEEMVPGIVEEAGLYPRPRIE